jgi:serine protease
VPSGRFVGGYDFVSSDVGSPLLAPNFVANDGNGRDPDPTDPGDWLTAADTCEDGTSGPLDSSWHGTHMAGVVAASGNNGTGIAGIGWNVRVQPLRALGKCGGALTDIADAIRWAAGLAVAGIPANPTPARVISLSLGSSEQCSNHTQSAVDAAIAAGTVVVAATGNESDTALISPANCRGVIAVTGHTINGENADYANIGAATTISAPGGGSPFLLGAGGPTDDSNWTGYYVWSTLLFGATDPSSSDAGGRSGASYGGFTGTSVAAPHVAGAAALIKSLLPSASAEQVRGFLVNNVRPFPVGSACATGGPFDGQCGAGLLDASAAVARAVLSAPPVIVSGPQSLSIVEGQTATLAVTAAGAATLRYQWKRNGVDVAGATSSSYTTPALSVGDSGTRYSVSVTNALGSVTSAEATITVTVASTGGPASPPVGGGGGGGALPLGQLLLLVALLAGARLRRRE